SVSDTAFLTAFCRALETERPDARFRDPYARILAGDRGEQVMQSVPGAELTVAGCTVRTCLMDAFIMRAIRETTIDTVVNLGAGLDTRPYRLPLAPSLCWIEVDNPAVLAYKASKLDGDQPNCALESVPMDVADTNGRRALLQRVGSRAHNVLVVTEGF